MKLCCKWFLICLLFVVLAYSIPIKALAVSVTCNAGNGVNTALGCVPTNDLNAFAGWFVSKAIYIASGIAFLFMIYGGFLLLTSAGDPNKVKAGTELIGAALSGLLFIIVSVLLLQIIGVDILQIPGFSK